MPLAAVGVVGSLAHHHSDRASAANGTLDATLRIFGQKPRATRCSLTRTVAGTSAFFGSSTSRALASGSTPSGLTSGDGLASALIGLNRSSRPN
jgi:hypothetical protein